MNADPGGATVRAAATTVGLIAVAVMVVGMLACVKPTLRAIRIRPMEALMKLSIIRPCVPGIGGGARSRPPASLS